ncbi:MAG TPA: NAD(P)-binding domain-containing protein, partial [Candidatus Hydrogenedentes bacterium]|nr:NAD(P)-binding domain-containing protein [Candidatus Hydrogenedentota bacterium]
MSKMDLGVVGLGVMGRNIVLNFESRGYGVVAYARRPEVVAEFVNGAAKGKKIMGTSDYAEMCANLASPRAVMLMVTAGEAVDAASESLLPLLA